MYVQDIALPSSRNKNIGKINKLQDYSGSMKSSHHENRQALSERSSRQTENISGESEKKHILRNI